MTNNKPLVEHKPPRVLIVGIYLANKTNTITHLTAEFSRSKQLQVDQKWAALNGLPPTASVMEVTAITESGFIPKFTLINRLLSDTALADYDFIIVCDDDIFLPKHFLDCFIELQIKHDFSLCQPARTHNSYLDHAIVEVVDGLEARETRFVEIGPIFCVRKDAFDVLMPFDEEAPMGWGLDFVWPALMERKQLRMGIVDAVTADHSLRKPFTQYDGNKANDDMLRYLATREHLTPEEAFTVKSEIPAAKKHTSFLRRIFARGRH